MVLWDLIKTTVLALIGVSSVLTLGGAMLEATRQGLNPVSVLALMPYLIPPTLPYTMPACILFACTVVYGRMSSMLEITALKAGGIHVMRILWPAILLSILASAFGIYLGDQFIPTCNRWVREIVLSDIQSTIYTYLKQTGSLPPDPDFPYEIYVDNVRGDRLINPIFKHRTPSGNYDLVTTASEATLHVLPSPDEDSDSMIVELRLINAISSSKGTLHLRDTTQVMPVPRSAKNADEKIETLSFRGCIQRAEERLNKARQLDMEMATLATTGLLSGNPEIAAKTTLWNRNQAKRFRRKAREARAELHLRIAQAVVAIPFVLLGCPIGILYQRRDFLQTFFVCFLPIITIYYPMMILCFNIFKEGAGPLVLSLWGPTFLMCVFSIPFLRRVIRF